MEKEMKVFSWAKEKREKKKRVLKEKIVNEKA